MATQTKKDIFDRRLGKFRSLEEAEVVTETTLLAMLNVIERGKKSEILLQAFPERNSREDLCKSLAKEVASRLYSKNSTWTINIMLKEMVAC